MTVTYTAEVASCKKFGCFLKLLFRWRGSIYKLVWTDLILFLITYYCLSLIYHFALPAGQKKVFEHVVEYCATFSTMTPVLLPFVLGFYVRCVMDRWWEQYSAIPWPDSIAVFVSAHICGENDRARLMRRTIMRYVCLCQAIVFSMISPRVMKRFPTDGSLVNAGLMLENERLVFEGLNESFPKVSKYWMPIVWAASIVARARKEGLIRDDFAVKTIVDELNKFRGLCGTLLLYDLIPIPLVYTQVVTIAVYSFFLSSVLGQQWIETKSTHYNIDLYFPLFTALQFFFYMGWLKVAESLINPFGEDDDDFEVSWMIDRNLQVSYLIVDEMHQNHPDLVKDQYWDEVFPSELPYDGDVKHEEPPEPSTAKLGEKLATMSTIRIDRGLRDSRAPVSPAVSFLGVDSERFERRDSLKRTGSSASAEERAVTSHYELAVGSPMISPAGEIKPRISLADKVSKLDVGPTTEVEPTQPPEVERPRRIMTEGIFESSIETLPEVTEESMEAFEQAEEEPEREKDDFTKLKEERDRKRAERQLIRFVERIENLSNVKTDRDKELASKASDVDIEEYDSAEEDPTTVKPKTEKDEKEKNQDDSKDGKG